MDLQTLRFFCVAATEGSLTRAAQRLSYAQSNLSTRIHALEEELGVILFERSSDGVRLTPKGELLFTYAQRMLKLADETASAVQDEGTPGGKVRLGSMDSAALSLLPSLLKKYHEEYPNVRVILSTMPSQQAIQSVLDSDLDAAIVGGEVRHPRLNCLPLTHERLVLISADPGSVEEQLRKPLVVFPRGCTYRRRLEELQGRYGLPTEGILEMNSFGAVFASVSAGLGVSLFPQSTIAAMSESRCLAITELPYDQAEIPVSLVYRRDGYVPSSVRAMAASFRSSV